MTQEFSDSGDLKQNKVDLKQNKVSGGKFGASSLGTMIVLILFRWGEESVFAYRTVYWGPSPIYRVMAN
jgi:hypothetical protein